ncbi:MAG: Ig-like domain-containing protein, partial [Longimicrobiales bacterium]
MVLHRGAEGSPGAGTVALPSGTLVDYSFTPKAGFDRIRVRRDTLDLPAAGSFELTSDATLFVTADTLLTVTSANAAVVEALRRVLVDPTPMAAYRHLQGVLDDLFTSMSHDDAHRELATARVLAIKSEDDIAALRAAMLEIGDSLQALEEDALLVAPERQGDSSRAPTTFIYVNGIYTDPFEASTTIRYYLEPVLAEAGYGDRRDFPVRRAWNQSSKEVSNGEAFQCLELRVMAIVFGGQWSMLSDLAECFRFLAFFLDLDEAASQYVNQVLGSLAPTRDVELVAGVTRATLAGGSRVILIAHSQGNLIVNDALRVLESDPGVGDLDCVGVVSVAPPLPVDGRGATVSSLIVGGRDAKDVLLVFPRLGLGQGVPVVSNGLSDSLDAVPFEGLVRKVIFPFSFGMALHRINESYLSQGGAEGGTRGAIVSAVQRQVESVTQRCSPAPEVTQVRPDPVTGSSTAQPFTVIGSGFLDGATVTLRDVTNGQTFPDRSIRTLSPSEIVIDPVFTTAAASWSVQVINPGGVPSNEYPFEVLAGGAVDTVVISPATATVAIGAVRQFTATLKDSSGRTLTGASVRWTSSAEAIATIDAATGLVAGRAPGKVTITALAHGTAGQAELTVVDEVPLSITTENLPNGRIGQLYFALLQATGGGGEHVWSVTAGGTPPGINLSDGALSGVPTAEGSWSFDMMVSSGGQSAVAEFNRSIAADAPCPGPIEVMAITAATTWSPGSPGCLHFIVRDRVTVRSAMILEPGVNVGFAAGAGLTVASSGSLHAVGTPSALIRFLPLEPVRGYWRGITFASDQAANELSYVEVAYG